MALTKEERRIMLNHYDVLSAFNSDYYMDLITKDNLGDETVIKVNEEQIFVFPVKYRGKLYAIPSEIVEKDKLPIKITDSDKIAYRTNVYHLVKRYASARIKEEKTMSFRELANSIGDFIHTEKEVDYLIYKIAVLTLYMRKGFMRCVSEAAFGKNSTPTILKTLMTDVAVINPRSTPAVEHKLINKMVVLDELTNLEKSQRDLMQEALLRLADWSPSYEKGTRGSAKFGTKDNYDISKLSVMIMYNIFEYYVEVGQQDKYFDNIFQFAVKDRFFPIKCEGVLDGTQFIDVAKPREIASELKEDIKRLIRAIKYYQNNFEKEDKNFKIHHEVRLSKSGRIDKTFNTICQGLRLYATDEIEYNKLVTHLIRMHHGYMKMVAQPDVTEVPLSEVEKTAKDKQEALGSFIPQ